MFHWNILQLTSCYLKQISFRTSTSIFCKLDNLTKPQQCKQNFNNMTFFSSNSNLTGSEPKKCWLLDAHYAHS